MDIAEIGQEATGWIPVSRRIFASKPWQRRQIWPKCRVFAGFKKHSLAQTALVS
jgi:hypothetical protein